MKKILSFTLGLLLLTTGCSQPRSLSPDGYYGRLDAARPAVTDGLTLGQQLVQIDQNIIGAKNLLDGFVLWEFTNRPFIQNEPLKAFANKVRKEAPGAIQSAVRVRDAYASDPSGGRTKINAALAVLDSLLLELATHRP